MLLTLLMNLNMFGQPIPPPIPPTPIPSGGGGAHREFTDGELISRRLKRRLLKEDDELLLIIKLFMKLQ